MMKLRTKLTAAALTLAIAGGVGVTAVQANTQAPSPVTSHQVRQQLQDFDRENFNVDDFDFAVVRDRLIQAKAQLIAMSDDEMRELVTTHLGQLQGRMGDRAQMMELGHGRLAELGIELDRGQFNRDEMSQEELREILMTLLPEGFEGLAGMDRAAGGMGHRFHGLHRN